MWRKNDKSLRPYLAHFPPSPAPSPICAALLLRRPARRLENQRQKEGGEGDVSDMIAIKMGDAKESALQTAVSP